MGNNAAFTAFEATVIAVYNKGVLDVELLKQLAEPYAGSDIDMGGKEGTLSKDGLEIEEIVLKVMGVEIPKRPDIPPFLKYSDRTPEQETANERYWEDLHERFFKITDDFGWR
jgi:hypothetical protein